MGNTNSRGQCITEFLMIMLLLSAIIMTYLEYAGLAVSIFRPTQLSQELK